MARTTFSLGFEAKDFFFDRKAVQDALGKAEARELSRIGAFIRTTARRTVLRNRKRVSEPGEAPSVHSKDRVATLRNILFSYSPQSHSVIVGPVKLNQVNRVFDIGNQTVPQILEFGGTVVISEERYKKSDKWFRRDLRYSASANKVYRERLATYRPRPFMSKALELEINAGTIRNIWRASIG